MVVVADLEGKLCQLLVEFGKVCKRKNKKANENKSRIMKCTKEFNSRRMNVAFNSGFWRTSRLTLIWLHLLLYHTAPSIIYLYLCNSMVILSNQTPRIHLMNLYLNLPSLSQTAILMQLQNQEAFVPCFHNSTHTHTHTHTHTGKGLLAFARSMI